MNLTFVPYIGSLGFLPKFSQLQAKNEPMLFNCDYEHARRFGGPITHALLDQIPEEWRTVPLVVDTKSAMLMPGWFPCIPGWHHDDVERRGPHNQPDYLNKSKSAKFIMTLVGAEYSATEFLADTVTMLLPPPDKVVYAEWDRNIQFAVADDQVSTISAKDHEIIMFDDNTFHQGTVSKKSGWRYFGRVSRYYEHGIPVARGNKRTNEVRKQVQIYMSAEKAGW